MDCGRAAIGYLCTAERRTFLPHDSAGAMDKFRLEMKSAPTSPHLFGSSSYNTLSKHRSNSFDSRNILDRELTSSERSADLAASGEGAEEDWDNSHGLSSLIPSQGAVLLLAQQLGIVELRVLKVALDRQLGEQRTQVGSRPVLCQFWKWSR